MRALVQQLNERFPVLISASLKYMNQNHTTILQIYSRIREFCIQSERSLL